LLLLLVVVVEETDERVSMLEETVADSVAAVAIAVAIDTTTTTTTTTSTKGEDGVNDLQEGVPYVIGRSGGTTL